MNRLAVFASALVLCGASPAHAQTLACAPGTQPTAGDPCPVERKADTELIIVRVLKDDGSAFPSAMVRLRATIGTVEDSVFSNAYGLAVALWKAAPNMGTAIPVITATVDDGKRNSQLTIALKPPAAKNTIALIAPEYPEAWYAGRQLPFRIEIDLPGVSIADCRSQSVYFKALGTGAEVTPDTVRADVEANRCVATTRWKLGPTVGMQSLRANVIGSSAPPAIIDAKARKEPWLAAGFAASYDHGFVGVKDGLPDSSNIKAHVTLTPTLGINTPILTRWSGYRFSASFDIKKPTTDWYGGLSIPQFFGDLWQEDTGADLQLVVHVSKRTVPDDPAKCDTSACKTDTRTRPVGLALNLQLNASVLITALTTIFK